MEPKLDEAEKLILGALLADFNESGYCAGVLKRSYEGPKVPAIEAAVTDGVEVTKVDFDIAFEDLEKKKLIRTGPYKLYEPEETQGLVFIGLGYSLREYACLTELGYKTARKRPNQPSRVPRIVNNFNFSEVSHSNIQVASGSDIAQKLDARSGASSEVLAKVIEIMAQHGHAVSPEQRVELETSISHAQQGNGGEAKDILAKVCGPAWEHMQPVLWPIVGAIAAKALGL